MPGISEVGACSVNVESFQCSIKKIVVTTKWKAPDKEVDEMVSTTVYDNVSKTAKNMYLVSSPKGKEITIKVDRDGGRCIKQPHKVFSMAWPDYEKDEKGTTQEVQAIKTQRITSVTTQINYKGLAIAAAKDAALSTALPFLIPYHLIKTPKRITEVHNNERSLRVKCFEVGGAFEALKYWRLPIPVENNYLTKFSYLSCREGLSGFQVISYPDISCKLEFTLDSEKNATDPTRNPITKKFDWCRPKFEATTTYNGKQDKIVLKIDFNKDAEDYVYLKYIKQNNVVAEFGSGILQQLPNIVKNFTNFLKAVKKICTHEFIQDFLAIDTKKLKDDYKIGSFKMVPPSVSLTVEGKYNTSRDLLRIGKFYSITLACDPLIGVTYKLDLLYLLLNWATAGVATGVYLLIKNLKPIIEGLLGDDIKSPASADVFIDLEITGKINASLNYIIDTIKSNEGSNKLNMTPVEGVIDFDLKAGAKASIDFFCIATASAEASMTLSSGFTFQVGFENHLKEGIGLVVPFGILFNGAKIKWVLKASAGLKKVTYKKSTSKGVQKEGEKKLLDKAELYSHDFVFLKPKGDS